MNISFIEKNANSFFIVVKNVIYCFNDFKCTVQNANNFNM